MIETTSKAKRVSSDYIICTIRLKLLTPPITPTSLHLPMMRHSSSRRRSYGEAITKMSIQSNGRRRFAFLLRPILGKQLPQLAHAHTLLRQHAILEPVQILPMNRWDELARDNGQEDAGREVMLADAVAELCILREGLS